MEVLVLLDFEGTMGDEITVRAGDVVKNVTVSSEEGWLEGELRGKRGIFPANFVKEVPVYLKGDSKREPRSLRKTTMMKEQCRKCEVTYAYTPVQQDELELAVGETIEIIKEIEDGWWMGKKDGKIGAFPSNFVKEIFVYPKDVKTRAKLSEALFIKEGAQQQRASIRKKTNIKECCQVMFDYTANAEDELDLKKGDIVTIINKVNDDEGWWEGEVNGRRGFFPDNFVMIIPMEALQEKSQPPQRRGTEKHSVNQASGMDRRSTEANTKTETKEEKSEAKDLRCDVPGKIKLPGFFKASPPPVKDKPQKLASKPSDDQPPISPKLTDSKPKDSDQFDGIDVSSAKLNHPTANRAKPPQRRLPSHTPAFSDTNQIEASAPTETDGADKTLPVPPKATGNNLPLNKKTSTILAPQHPTLCVTQTVTKPAEVQEKPTLEQVVAELKELRMEMELFKTRHNADMKELKDELNEERNKRMKLQDEVQVLRRQK
ncbi:SH3 domain-containing protein 21 isoform X1 [Pangasianodon hypophthalmus]|uniref:SH3 domain-containing protein 21 isoform X1 n=1 Tax=Pangasianodon hypophthalmus TaxID=310915 RepID=UPI000EFFCA28|nr:SH3 domain-containing protein 21 isoform X1 [Pangasianodon hypophthalmus]